MAEPVKIEQGQDFVVFSFDGVDVEVDVLAAYEEMVRIDVRHRDDLWICYKCQREVSIPADLVVPACPLCESTAQEDIRKDERWLDDVAAWVRGMGVARCSRRGAAEVYKTVVDIMDVAKKKPAVTLESPTGSGSTVAAGAE